METELLIDNQKRVVDGGASFERRHPASGDLVTRAAAASVRDAIAAATSAGTAFQTWRHSTSSERRRLLLKAADLLEAKTPQFIEAMAAEVGAAALWAAFMLSGLPSLLCPMREAPRSVRRQT